MAYTTKNEREESVHLPPIANQGPPPLPDGGFWAWMQCAGGFCILFNTWGMLNSFATFQAFYERDFLHVSTASQISWIGTVQSSFIMLGSLYSGPLYDHGYLRPLIWVGSSILVFGMFMTSLCTKYWHVLLTQGVLMGLETGCLFTPTTGIIASYFDKKRGLAMGIVSTGSTIGGIVYPVMFHKLIGSVGYGWTTRAIAFVMLALSVLPASGMRVRTKTPPTRHRLDLAAFKEPKYSLFAISMFVGYLGLYIPFFYIQLYSLEKSNITGELNFYLLPIMNATGFIGQLVLGHLADQTGPLNAIIISAGACGAPVFGWIGMGSNASVILFCILYGFFSFGLSMLPANVVAVALCPDMRQYGVRMTMQMVPAALGLLIGNPIAGAILKADWMGLQAFSAALIFCAAAFAVAVKCSKTGLSSRAQHLQCRVRLSKCVFTKIVPCHSKVRQTMSRSSLTVSRNREYSCTKLAQYHGPTLVEKGPSNKLGIHRFVTLVAEHSQLIRDRHSYPYLSLAKYSVLGQRTRP